MSDLYPEIERNKTVLQTLPCPCCGRTIPIRMNNSARAYFVCRWPTGDDGQQCKEEQRLSVKRTAEIVRKFNQDKLKMKGPDNGKETDSDAPAKRTGNGIYDRY